MVLSVPVNYGRMQHVPVFCGNSAAHVIRPYDLVPLLTLLCEIVDAPCGHRAPYLLP
eukprot:COSAG02_NODE_26789_length_624_cov_1.205714_1_plen_56_part_10